MEFMAVTVITVLFIAHPITIHGRTVSIDLTITVTAIIPIAITTHNACIVDAGGKHSFLPNACRASVQIGA